MTLIAQWTFSEVEALTWGEDIKVSARHTAVMKRPRDGDQPLLRMQVAGASEMRLGFKVKESINRPAVLKILHAKSCSQVLPFRGLVCLNVRLDGLPVQLGYEVSNSSPVLDSIHLTEGRLEAGDHTLVIQLADTSTTTYRPWLMRLEAEEEPQ